VRFLRVINVKFKNSKLIKKNEDTQYFKIPRINRNLKKKFDLSGVFIQVCNFSTINSRKHREHKMLLCHGNKLLLWSF
jgi:hypothetical protein